MKHIYIAPQNEQLFVDIILVYIVCIFTYTLYRVFKNM